MKSEIRDALSIHKTWGFNVPATESMWISVIEKETED